MVGGRCLGVFFLPGGSSNDDLFESGSNLNVAIGEGTRSRQGESGDRDKDEGGEGELHDDYSVRRVEIDSMRHCFYALGQERTDE